MDFTILAQATFMFGLSAGYGPGADPSLAANNAGLVVEVHPSQGASNTLWSQVGTVTGLTVEWGPSVSYDEGLTPTVAINNRGVVVEVHETNSPFNLDTYYRVGRISEDGKGVDWKGSVQYDSGKTPAVALNDAGQVIEVHRNSRDDDRLWSRSGRVNGDRIDWGQAMQYDHGRRPRVAINNKGQAVEFHSDDGQMRVGYRVGRVTPAGVEWGPAVSLGDGSEPAVGLRDDGTVVLVRTTQGKVLVQATGRVNGDRIDWAGWGPFDLGKSPAVALSDRCAIQVHRGEAGSPLPDLAMKLGELPSRLPRARNLIGPIDLDETDQRYFSTSLLVDRADWMANLPDAVKDKPLKDIVMPGAHDAAMYSPVPAHHPIEPLGQTQSLNFYEQLRYGVRYFDLRAGEGATILNPAVPRVQAVMHAHHGAAGGPPMTEILDDIKRYMEEGHRELVILKISCENDETDVTEKYFNVVFTADLVFKLFGLNRDSFAKPRDFDARDYAELRAMIQDRLGRWLFPSLPEGRLGDRSLRSLVADQGRVLVVVPGNFAAEPAVPGIYVYCDAEVDFNIRTALMPGDYHPEKGRLTVFDRYSNTLDFGAMRSDQIGKFARYAGQCTAPPTPTPCDMFLLSWTLTPVTGVSNASRPANRSLGAALSELGRNTPGRVPNILYVDFVENARVTDVAIDLNLRLAGLAPR